MCIVITTRLAEEEPGSRENRIDRWSTAPAQRGLRTLLTLRWRVGKELTLGRCSCAPASYLLRPCRGSHPAASRTAK